MMGESSVKGDSPIFLIKNSTVTINDANEILISLSTFNVRRENWNINDFHIIYSLIPNFSQIFIGTN